MEEKRSAKRGYRFNVGLSALMHIIFIIFLLFSIDMESGGSHSANMQKVDIVHAAVIDENAVQQEVKRLEKIEFDQKAAAEKKEQLYTQKLEEAKTARLQEQAKLLQLKKDMQKAQREEESRLAEIKLAKEKERQELAALQQQKAEAKEKERKELEALQKKEQEKTALAAATKAKALDATAATAAAKAKALETAAAIAQKSKWLASEEEKNWALFKDKVNQSWIRAPGLPTGLRCKLDIRLLPDGSVMAVQVLNSSGNVAFDQSALAAVEKSAPLPVPQEPALIEKFRHFTFEFNPDEHQTGVIFN